MTMPRVTALGLLAAGVLAGSVLVGAAPAAAANPIEQPCGGTSWWAGSTNVCDGTVVHRDYVNDDEGSDDGGLGFNGTQNAFGTLAHPAGDKRYPADRISSADLVRLELTRVGDRVEVLMDGGIRRGADVAIALALGARAVCVGRPVVWGLAANGEEGARDVLELLRAELELALALLGCASPEDLGRSHVARAER